MKHRKPTPEELLAAGRGKAPLRYDVTRGLLRHRHWIEQGAALPAWAQASALASKPWLGSLLAKYVGGACVIACVAGLAYRFQREQPSPPLTAAAAATDPAPSMPPPSAALAPVAAPATRAFVAPPVRTATPSAPPLAPARPRQRATAARAQPAPPSATPVATSSSPPPTAASRAPDEAPRPELRPVPTDLDEMQQLARAEQLLPHAPARALALVRAGEAQFSDGYFRQERAYVGVVALARLGRDDEARLAAARFVAEYPGSPYIARIRRALQPGAK